MIILTGLVMNNVAVAPEGGADESVFSIGYWYNSMGAHYAVSRGVVLQNTKL